MTIHSLYALHWDLCGEPGIRADMAHSYERVYSAEEVDEEIDRLARIIIEEAGIEDEATHHEWPKCGCPFCAEARSQMERLKRKER